MIENRIMPGATSKSARITPSRIIPPAMPNTPEMKDEMTMASPSRAKEARVIGGRAGAHCSPPPCGEGQGWGSRGKAQASTLSHHLPTPYPTLPHKGGGKHLRR